MIDFNPILDEGCDKDDALLPPVQVREPGGIYQNGARRWQGVPAIERTPAGRILFAFYSGQTDEGIGNYVVLFKTDDEGATMEEPFLAVVSANPKTCRVFDPCLWMDPQGRLWLFVAQSYTYYDGRNGVWAMVCENYDAPRPTFTPPRRIANGIMMNKPLVWRGNWLMPCAIWDKFQTTYNDLPEERFSNVYRSTDGGKSFSLLSHVDYPDRHVDEHMMVEMKDGRILMLIRGKHGIGQSVSPDGGQTWEPPTDSGLGGPCSRFCIRSLKNGKWLLINHYHFKRRDHLTAMLSDDDGTTWKGFLVLDERSDVSYPDAVEAEDGTIYVIYDRERYDAREILMAKITQADILSGALVEPGSRLKILLNRATGEKTD